MVSFGYMMLLFSFSVNDIYIQLINILVWVSSLPTDFLCTSSLTCWEGYWISNYNCGFFCLFRYVSFCFVYFEVLLLGAYIFKIVLSWWVGHLIIVKLSFVIFLILKSSMSGIIMAAFNYLMSISYMANLLILLLLPYLGL